MLTKPAGVGLQLLAIPLMFGSCGLMLDGFSDTGETSMGFVGVLLMLLAAALLAIGRKPATRGR